MEIRICEEKNGLPPHAEVSEVMRLICEKTGLDIDRIHLKYIGGDRRKHFPRKGIKLMHSYRWNVQLYIGCDNETVETILLVRLGDGKEAMPGHEVFERLNRICNKRIFCVVDELIKRKRQEGNGDSKSPHLQEIPAPETAVRESVEASVSLQIPETPDDDPEEVSVPPGREQEYDGYFDDPANLHLGVCALVALANEDCEAPFSFELFIRAMMEINVPETAGLKMSLMRAFLYRNFMRRLNPGVKPRRYTITSEALNFARGPIPKAMVKTTRLKNLKDKPDRNEEHLAKSAKNQIAKLRQIFDDHQAVLLKLQADRARLVELHKVNIVEQERDIEGQVKNLQKRLNELTEASLDLAKRRSDIAATEQRIRKMEDKSKDPEISKALAEFEEFRKLFA